MTDPYGLKSGNQALFENTFSFGHQQVNAFSKGATM